MQDVSDPAPRLNAFFQRLSSAANRLPSLFPDHVEAASAYYYATPVSQKLQKTALAAEVLGLAAFGPTVAGPVAAFALAAWSLYFFKGPVGDLKRVTTLPIDYSLPIADRTTDHLLRELDAMESGQRVTSYAPKSGRLPTLRESPPVR